MFLVEGGVYGFEGDGAGVLGGVVVPADSLLELAVVGLNILSPVLFQSLHLFP